MPKLQCLNLDWVLCFTSSSKNKTTYIAWFWLFLAIAIWLDRREKEEERGGVFCICSGSWQISVYLCGKCRQTGRHAWVIVCARTRTHTLTHLDECFHFAHLVRGSGLLYVCSPCRGRTTSHVLLMVIKLLILPLLWDSHCLLYLFIFKRACLFNVALWKEAGTLSMLGQCYTTEAHSCSKVAVFLMSLNELAPHSKYFIVLPEILFL